MLRARNEGLVYARMTGWGQDGPLAQRAGHEINYIGLVGVLEPIGRDGERPHAPLNILGDFAGGGMLMTLGIVAARFERSRSGQGQVVDAAMVDGASLLMCFLHGTKSNGSGRAGAVPISSTAQHRRAVRPARTAIVRRADAGGGIGDLAGPDPIGDGRRSAARELGRSNCARGWWCRVCSGSPWWPFSPPPQSCGCVTTRRSTGALSPSPRKERSASSASTTGMPGMASTKC
ncbi:CoA transferase [Nocardioides sp. LML1-1-1.1]